MRKITFFILTSFIFINVSAQDNPIPVRPELPSNYRDTLIIVHEEYEKNKKNKEIVSFKLQDKNWTCKEINFIHYIAKNRRKMDKLFLTKKELKRYETITYEEIKKRNIGCNELESYLIAPTLYFAFKKRHGYVAYEVLPIVWGIIDD